MATGYTELLHVHVPVRKSYHMINPRKLHQVCPRIAQCLTAVFYDKFNLHLIYESLAYWCAMWSTGGLHHQLRVAWIVAEARIVVLVTC